VGSDDLGPGVARYALTHAIHAQNVKDSLDNLWPGSNTRDYEGILS